MWRNLFNKCRPMFQSLEEILVHIDSQTTILDIGCGYGDLCAQIAAQKSPQHILGIDNDEYKIQTAQKQYADIPNLQFEVADLLRLKDVDAQTILIINVLHHFTTLDQIALLQKLVANRTVQKIIVHDTISSAHPGYILTRLHEFIKGQSTQFTYLTPKEWHRMASTLHMKITIEKVGTPLLFNHLIIFTR